jgi:hypothetical protein
VQARPTAVGRPAGQSLGHLAQRGQQLVEPGALARGHAHDRHARHQLRGLLGGQLRLADVGLRDRHHPVLDAELAEHREVLARLRHHAVVGGDAQQKEVHARGARDHRPHEALVPGDVDHRQPSAVP